MAQLRQEHDQFAKQGVAILIVGPENAKKFADYFSQHHLPFTGLPDPKHRVLKQFGQEVKIFKFGRMPAQVFVDKTGIVRFVHYGHSMSDIPSNEELLSLVQEINQEEIVNISHQSDGEIAETQKSEINTQ
jgi:peroxiredoxin Q/BCP